MSDLDNAVVTAMIKAKEIGVKMLASDCEAILKAAIASMQGEAVAWRYKYTNDGDWIIASKLADSATENWVRDNYHDFMIESLYTHAPDSAARIAEQDARIKELESQLVSTDQLSVHDIRIGMSALLQCEVSEIEAMDNRCYDESYQAVQRVIEAISLSVKQEKLFGNEIYQAAANHFEQKIKELEQQLEVVRIKADRYDWIEKQANKGATNCGQVLNPNLLNGHRHRNRLMYSFLIRADNASEPVDMPIGAAIDAAIRQIGGAE